MTTVRRGWFHLASGAGLGRLFGFVSNLLLSRWLGPTDLGLFNLVTTTVQTTDTLVRCGGDYALTFELGGKADATNTQSGRILIRAFAQLCSLTTLIACFATSIWVWTGKGLFPSLSSQRCLLTALLVVMIFCECISASAWEVLLVSRRTRLVSLRQGLFFPIRLLSAAVGALCAGVSGAMVGWSLVAIAQCIWLKTVLGPLWQPLQIWPPLTANLVQLLRRGLPFYTSNLLSSVIFFPLLLKVSEAYGLSDIGYLRVGQILQQVFAFLPATLVPVLFLRLRTESSFSSQIFVVERPLRITWLILLEVLLLYCIFDQSIIFWLFGPGYASALLPTRFLLITSLFESLTQLIVQPLLAAGHTRTYGLWQNCSALFAAVVGWLWIPSAGIQAYLIVRLLYVTIPLLGFANAIYSELRKPRQIFLLLIGSAFLLLSFLAQALTQYSLSFSPYVYLTLFVIVAATNTHDVLFMSQFLRRKS